MPLGLVVGDLVAPDEIRPYMSEVSMIDACSTSQPGKPFGKTSARSASVNSGNGFSRISIRTSGWRAEVRSQASQMYAAFS